MQELADNVKLLRYRHNDGRTIDPFEAIQTINALVDLVAQMRNGMDFLINFIDLENPYYDFSKETITKADAFLTTLKE